MSRASAIQTSFNAGELSPRMHGRVDQAAYAIGCETMLGWFPALQGPAVAMQGFHFVEAAPGPFRNIPFEYNVTQTYTIEASDHLFRFYTNDVLIEGADLATPYSHAQVLELDFAQSLDVLYLVHPEVAPRQLRRLSATSFELVMFDTNGGPFADGNNDAGLTVSASNDVGDVYLTANVAGFFDPGDVGSLFQLEAADYSLDPAWEPGITVGVNSRRASDGKIYLALDTGKTGSIQPIHTEGVAYDGMAVGTDTAGKAAGGVRWEYLHDFFGVLRIEEIGSDGAVARALVLRRLTGACSTPTSRWAFGAFSARRGWPEAVTIWNERLVFGKGATTNGSVVGSYGDFSARDDAGDFERDQAFTVRLPNPNRVRWLAADRKLLIGTARAEHIAEQLQVQTGTAGPPVIQVDTISNYGSANTRPAMADGRVLFIQRAGRKVQELRYADQDYGDDVPDKTRLADHIGVPGLVELAWLQEPERQLWAARGDGTLACMTFSAADKVAGWARRELGGGLMARTLCAVTDPAGDRDQLWVGAETADGQWWQLRQARLRDTGDAKADAVYLDAAMTYAGPPIAAGTGAGHLTGRTVDVLADGKPHPPIAIGAGGSWTLAFAASNICLGLSYPARLTTLPVEAGGEGGPAQGRKKRITGLILRLLECGAVSAAVQGLPPQELIRRSGALPMGAENALFTGDAAIDTGGDFERRGQLTIERTQPAPACVLAVIAQVETSA